MSTLTWNSRRSQQEHPGAPVWLASPTNRPRPCLSGDGRAAIDPDAALVEQLREGNAGAAEALVDAYGHRIYRLAIRITGNTSDAEEVVQDAAYQKVRGRRRKRNEVSWEDLALSFDEKGQHAEVPVDWSGRLKDPAIETELKSVLCATIEELPADYRTAFLLHDVEGLSNLEIAETLHVKLGAQRARDPLPGALLAALYR